MWRAILFVNIKRRFIIPTEFCSFQDTNDSRFQKSVVYCNYAFFFVHFCAYVPTVNVLFHRSDDYFS